MIGATMVDWVDEQDQPFAVIPRAEVFGLKAGFRVVHVFIFDKNGALLLQKLSLTRERYPSRWGSAVAGYVAAGEDYRQAAYRRLAAELDVRDCALAGIGKTLMLDQGCRKFIMLYAALHDGPFVIDREHISAVQFLSPHGIAAMLKEHPAYVTPTFRHLWSFYTRTRNQG